jgi:hypothetical protein
MEILGVSGSLLDGNQHRGMWSGTRHDRPLPVLKLFDQLRPGGVPGQLFFDVTDRMGVAGLEHVISTRMHALILSLPYRFDKIHR